jgi:hypothetical protein
MEYSSLETKRPATLDEKYQHLNRLIDEAIAMLKIHALNNIAARWLLIDLYFAKGRLRMVYELLKGGAA